MFIGLNPSKADEIIDDPTVRRFMGYAKDWGYAGCCVGNEFGFRATLPEDMKAAEDPVGPDNNHALIKMAKEAGIVVAAWGNHGNYMGRDKEVRAIIPQLHYLRLTKSGFPSHVLYLPKGLKPVPFTGMNFR